MSWALAIATIFATLLSPLLAVRVQGDAANLLI